VRSTREGDPFDLRRPLREKGEEPGAKKRGEEGVRDAWLHIAEKNGL